MDGTVRNGGRRRQVRVKESGLSSSPDSFCRHVFVPAVLDSSLPARVVGSERNLRFGLWTGRRRSSGTTDWIVSVERSGQPRWFGRRQVQSPSTRTAQHEAAVLDSNLLAAVVGPERKERSSWDGPGGFGRVDKSWCRRGSKLPARRRLCRRLGSGARGFDPAGLVGSGRRGGLSSSAFRLGWSGLPKSLTSGGSMKEDRVIGSQPADATGTVAFEVRAAALFRWSRSRRAGSFARNGRCCLRPRGVRREVAALAWPCERDGSKAFTWKGGGRSCERGYPFHGGDVGRTTRPAPWTSRAEAALAHPVSSIQAGWVVRS